MVRPQLIKEFHLWQLNTNALNRSYEYQKYHREDKEDISILWIYYGKSFMA